MTTQLHDTGEEYILDKLSGESVTVGLFEDAVDALSDTSDLSDITTEPSGSAYSRLSTTVSTADGSDGDWELRNDDEMVFDTSDSSRDVDAYFVVVNFQSDDTGDGSANDHLLYTGSFDDTLPLDVISEVVLQQGDIFLSLD